MKNKRAKWVDLWNWLIVFAIFLLGLWFTVIQPLEPNLSRLPGDLGDTRFNNYILEHDFRWITGRDSSLWNAPFFYPYSQTLTFSDNLFGSMLFYDVFRWSGLNRESALQGWYLFSFFFNFSAAALVLRKYSLKPLAVTAGAFLFTFGLPVLAQEGHVQLAYRFCVPLACDALWQFSQQPRIKQLALLALWLVWQFYLSIYLGYFLFLLLFVVAIGSPLTKTHSLSDILRYWPDRFQQAWKCKSTSVKNLILYTFFLGSLFLALILLFQPYATASKAYGFERSWQEVSQTLPRIQSYLISDRSKIWHSISAVFIDPQTRRGEHQLFVGAVVVILLLAGFIWRFESRHREMVFLFLGSAIVLILLTLNVNGYSLYKILWHLPGINSIRAVTRIILVLMWPLSLFISVEMDALARIPTRSVLFNGISVLLLGIMVVESIYYSHYTFSKAEADARLQELRKQIPASVPRNPVLFVWNPDNTLWYANELDAMLLSQDLGWPVMNGYSGSLPPGYGPTQDCDQVKSRILNYMAFSNINDLAFYKDTVSRVVPVGLEPCQRLNDLPSPTITRFSGPFPETLFSGISIQIISMTKRENYLVIHVNVENHSSQTLPALSSTQNPFRLSWRMIKGVHDNSSSGFNTRKDLFYDIPAGGHALIIIIATPPIEKGEYRVEVSAVQEGIAWFQDRGMAPAKSAQTIVVDDQHHWKIAK